MKLPTNKTDHWYVGREHAVLGQKRYKFQDQRLQKQYDEGFDSWVTDAEISTSEREFLARASTNQFLRRK